MSVEIQRVRADVCAAIFQFELNNFYGGTPIVEFVRIDDDINITISFDINPTAQNLTDLDTLLVAHDCTLLDDLETTGDSLLSNVLNNSGVTIASGAPVYITGFDLSSNLTTIAKADASNISKMPAFACVGGEAIEDGDEGVVYTSGQLTLMDTSMFSTGAFLYVAPGGGHTSTKPTGANLVQKMAEVIYSHAVNGKAQIYGAGRENDLPNITTNKVWMGDGSNVPVETNVYTESEVDSLISAISFTHPDPHLLSDGSTSIPTYSFSSDTNTGMYRESNGDIAFSQNGTCVFEITTSNTLIISNQVPNYENLVTSDDVIPNKKYVDDADIHSHALNDLTDVNEPSPTDAHVLTWDNGTSKWIGQPLPSSQGGDLPVAQMRRTTAYTIPESHNDVSFDTIDAENNIAIIDVDDDKHIDIKEAGLYNVKFTGYVHQTEGTTEICIKDIAGGITVLPGASYTLHAIQALDWEKYVSYNDESKIIPFTIDTIVTLPLNARVEVEMWKTERASVLQAGAVFSITKLSGVKGDIGATGNDGVSTITTQKDDVNITTATGTINFEGAVTVVDNGSGKATVNVTAQSGSGAVQHQITGHDSVLSEPMLFLTDTTRSNKVLSVETFQMFWAESEISDNDWIQIGHATDSDSAHVMPYDGTIIRMTANCENGEDDDGMDIELYVNGSVIDSPINIDGTGVQTRVKTNLNYDVNKGDRIRLRGDGDTIRDTNFIIWAKWRKV